MTERTLRWVTVETAFRLQAYIGRWIPVTVAIGEDEASLAAEDLPGKPHWPTWASPMHFEFDLPSKKMFAEDWRRVISNDIARRYDEAWAIFFASCRSQNLDSENPVGAK